MGALLDRFAAAGVRFALLAGDRLRAHGVLTDELRAAIREHKPTILAELADEIRYFRWRVAIPGRDPFEVRVLPESTAEEMREMYPAASVAPIPELAA